jgi:hypothetical protein
LAELLRSPVIARSIDMHQGNRLFSGKVRDSQSKIMQGVEPYLKMAHVCSKEDRIVQRDSPDQIGVHSRCAVEALKLEVNQAFSFQEISKIQAKYSQDFFLGTSSQPLRPKKAISWKVKRFVFRDLTRNTSARKSRIGRPRGNLNRMSVHHVQVKKGPLIKENVNPQSGKRKHPDVLHGLNLPLIATVSGHLRLG